MNIWSFHGFLVEEKKIIYTQTQMIYITLYEYLIFSWVCCGRKKDTQTQMINKWKYDYLQMMNRKKQHNFQICDGERNLCAGSLKICQTSPSKLARWAFILPCIVQCSHARSSWVVYICWMFIDNCVFDINLLQDATFVCVVSEIHVSRPPAPWEEHKNSKEYQFIK